MIDKQQSLGLALTKSPVYVTGCTNVLEHYVEISVPCLRVILLNCFTQKWLTSLQITQFYCYAIRAVKCTLLRCGRQFVFI